MIQRLHDWFVSVGIKPAVGDAFVAAVAYAAYNLIVIGNLDFDELRLAVGVFLLGVVGVAAPPGRSGSRTRDLSA